MLAAFCSFEQYLETSSPVAFAFLTIELADSIMDLQHVVDVAESASISAEVPGKSAFMPCRSPYDVELKSSLRTRLARRTD